MSSPEFTPPPAQQFRSPLGLPPGSTRPLGLAAPEGAPPPELGAPPAIAGELPPLPPAGGDDEVTLLRAIVVQLGDYKALPTVTENERVEATKAEQIVQRLLAVNEKLADTAMDTSPANRKLLGGV